MFFGKLMLFFPASEHWKLIDNSTKQNSTGNRTNSIEKGTSNGKKKKHKQQTKHKRNLRAEKDRGR